MLQKIRDRLTGVAAMVLMGLIFFSFVFWGIGDFGLGGGNFLAKVNGEPVDPRDVQNDFQRQLRAYQASFPDGVPPAELERIKVEVLQRATRGEALKQYTNAHGFRISDEQLWDYARSMDTFKNGEEFSWDYFESAALSAGLTTDGLTRRLRDERRLQQFTSGLVQTTFVTKAERDRRGSLEGETRVVSYVTIPVSGYIGEITVPPEAIAAEFAANQSLYETLEQLRAEYIELNPETISAAIEVDEQVLRERYDAGVLSGRYAAEETRESRHILLAADSGDSEARAAARAEAEALMARLEAGEDFAALAAEYSDDPGSKTNGGLLGWSPKSAFVTPFAEALFSMQEQELRGPVETRFGYHLIRLEGIRPSKPPPFEELRAEILREEQQQRAGEEINRLSGILDQAAYDDDDTLVPAADASGLAVQTTKLFSRGSGGGIAAERSFREAAFSDSVLLDRRNSSAVRVGDKYVYLRVVEHNRARPMTLAEATPAISVKLRNETAAQRARADGEVLLAELAAGGDLGELARARELTAISSQSVTRRGAALPPALAEAVFAAPVPSADAPVVDAIALRTGDFAVYVVESVTEGSSLDALSASRFGQIIGGGEWLAFVEGVTARADVETRPDQLQ